MPNVLYTEFVGIDVSKLKLDVYVSKSNKYFSVSNDESGIKSLLKQIKPSACQLVLIDLTGGYQAKAVKEFAINGYTVHRAEGRKVRQFIKSYGQKAKNDKIDAKMLTVYGAKMQETLRLHKHQDNQLQELVSRREDIKDMLQKERCRKERFTDIAAKRSLNKVIEVLEEQLKAIEKEIKDRLSKDEELKQKAKVIKSVKSVGDKTAMTLLAYMTELGKANRRQIAALAGLAPYANDSGQTSFKRRTSAGRPIVKRMLFMCALVAIKNNKDLKAFYERLISKGKMKMVAIVAVMRKLLVTINHLCKAFYIQRSFTLT
jgi:transposase